MANNQGPRRTSIHSIFLKLDNKIFNRLYWTVALWKTFLVKIQTNANQRKHIRHNNLLSKVSHTIKIIENFDHQNWSDFFVQEPIFLCQAEQVLLFLGI